MGIAEHNPLSTARRLLQYAVFCERMARWHLKQGLYDHAQQYVNAGKHYLAQFQKLEI